MARKWRADPTMAELDTELLTPFERAALKLARITNERPALKQAQQRYLRRFSQRWMRHTIAPRTLVDGLGWMRDWWPHTGVLLASNHRSFFDQYVLMLALYENGIEFPQKIGFPVRANFFYERPLGVLVNYLIGGGVMYPPIFRDNTKSEFNKDALERVIDFLDTPGHMVGIHPEGTRGKGPDPYEMLPAQPGIGQIVLHARPIVIPSVILGLSNDFVSDVRDTYSKGIRQRHPIVICFAEPLDYTQLAGKKPRLALYKKCADEIRASILDLMEREKQLRAACARGEIPDDDPRWLSNAR